MRTGKRQFSISITISISKTSIKYCNSVYTHLCACTTWKNLLIRFDPPYNSVCSCILALSHVSYPLEAYDMVMEEDTRQSTMIGGVAILKVDSAYSRPVTHHRSSTYLQVESPSSSPVESCSSSPVESSHDTVLGLKEAIAKIKFWDKFVRKKLLIKMSEKIL